MPVATLTLSTEQSAEGRFEVSARSSTLFAGRDLVYYVSSEQPQVPPVAPHRQKPWVVF